MCHQRHMQVCKWRHQPLRKSARRDVRRSGFFVWHSHTTRTRQPKRRRFRRFLMSLLLFARSFAFQKSDRVAGMTLPNRQEWRCQKQPCTRIACRRDRRTMSGLPGRSTACVWNEHPSRRTSARTSSSGVVSLPRMLAIHRRR